MAADGRDFTVTPPVQHVTILDHISALLNARDRHYDRMATDIQDQMSARDKHFDAILKEIDLRHQQRFDAQSQALQAAFDAQQTATQAALTSAEKAVTTAMIAAEKAVNKAETANEKRFEAVNEFRGQLNDQAATFMPRAEGEQRLSALSEKLDLIQTVVTAAGARSAGLSAGWGYLLGAVGLIGAVTAILLGNN